MKHASGVCGVDVEVEATVGTVERGRCETFSAVVEAGGGEQAKQTDCRRRVRKKRKE